MEDEQAQAEEAGVNDGMKLENEALKSELASSKAEIASLNEALAGKDNEITTIKQAAEDFKQKFDVTGQALAQAVAAYKELVAQANTGLVAEMIKGESIEEIKESAKSARALIERVRQEVGAENARVKVPAGAPPRTLPDFSALTAREKIKYGMEGG